MAATSQVRELTPAVKWFLERKLKSFNHYKNMSEEELDKKLAELNPPPEFIYPLRIHQKAMFLICLEEPDFLIFSGIGSGKTKIMLEVFSYLKKIGKVKKALIIALDAQNVDGWMDECQKHTPNLVTVPLLGTKSQRRTLLNREGDLYIVNYDGVQSILSDTAKREIYPKDVAALASRFQFLVVDECYELSNPQTINFQVVNILTNNIIRRYGLTGRAFGRDLMKLWGQYYVIDKGETLGKNIYIFRNSFFRAVKVPWGTKWVFRKELDNKLHEFIKNKSIQFSRSDYQKVKEPDRQVLKVELSPAALEYYKKISEDFISDHYDEWRKHIKGHWIKLRQICSGFLMFKLEDEEDESKLSNEILEFESNKDEVLTNLILSTPSDCKHIIYHEFIYTGQKLYKMMDKLGVGYVTLAGATKDKIGSKRAFQYDKDIQFLVANSRSGSTGLNLQMANYETFYESPASPIVREQAEGRISRDEQMHEHMNIYDPVVKDSVEEQILRFHKEGDNLYAAVMEGRAKRKDIVGKLGIS